MYYSTALKVVDLFEIMNNPITINKSLTSTVRLIFIFFSIHLISCQGQDKFRSTNERPIVSAEELKKPYKDPMFFLEGQLCQHLRCMFEDRRGHLWFGTNVYGLMHYDGDTLRFYDEKDGLGGGRINGFAEDKDGILWIATYEGLSKYDGKSFSNFDSNDGLIDSYVSCLEQTRDGKLWIGTAEGISIFDGIQFTNFQIPQVAVPDTTTRLSYNMVTNLEEDRYGNMWIGTDGFGVWKYNPNDTSRTYGLKGFSHLYKQTGLCDNNIMAIKQDSKGSIWIGTMFGGLSIVKNSEEKAGHELDKIINPTIDGSIEGEEVYGFFEDENQDMWFSAENHGVYKYDGLRYTNYYEDHKLPTNGILCIMKDSEQRFWFGGWGGLFRFDGSEFYSITKEGPWN